MTSHLDPRTHRVLSGVSRVAVLEAIRASADPLDAPTIAERVGLHPNTVRSHLDRLAEVGLVTSEPERRATPGRPRLLFRAVPTRPSADADSYRLLAGILAGGIGVSGSPREVAAEAGRRWGEQAAVPDAGPSDPVAGLVALLEEIGFAPATPADPDPADSDPADSDPAAPATVIELHRCPFGDVVREHQEVVCSVHLGLMQGALDRMHAPASVTLLPFVRPGVCSARIGTGRIGAGRIGAGRTGTGRVRTERPDTQPADAEPAGAEAAG